MYMQLKLDFFLMLLKINLFVVVGILCAKGAPGSRLEGGMKVRTRYPQVLKRSRGRKNILYMIYL